MYLRFRIKVEVKVVSRVRFSLGGQGARVRPFSRKNNWGKKTHRTVNTKNES